MDFELLNTTPMPLFIETPKKIKENNEIGEIIGLLTDAIEDINAEIGTIKSTTSIRIDAIEKHLKTTVENTNENQVLLGENALLKRKVEELEKKLKEKEGIIEALMKKLHNDRDDNWQKVTSTIPLRTRYETDVAPIRLSNRFEILANQWEQLPGEYEEMNIPSPSPTFIRDVNQKNTTISRRLDISKRQDNGNHSKKYQKTVPGNSSYRDAVKFGRKSIIIGTSMVKGIRMKEFNSYIKNGFVKLRSFTGATIKQLCHYAIPSLVDETPNRVVIQAGCNDVANRNNTPQEIAEQIMNLAEMCREYGVNEVFVSSLICRTNKYLNEKVTRINFLLNCICREKGFIFIDNKNIEFDDLYEDGLHLLEKGKIKLARNFIDFLNNFY